MLVKPDRRTQVLAAATAAFLGGASFIATALAEEVGQNLNAKPLPVALIAPQSASNGARPDISALRYYANRGEQDRLQAEIQRLKALYPNWKQPDNIFADESEEEQGLWSMFAEGDIDGITRQIAKLSEDIPGYQPSAELLDKVRQRMLRRDIAKAYKAEKWQSVVDQLNATPSLLVTNDLELLWFAAESYARLERPKDALSAFKAAFASSTTPQERRATMQKASGMLATEAALSLLDSAEELSLDEILRGEVEAAIVRGALGRSAQTGEELPRMLEKHVAKFEKDTRASGQTEDAELLAWSNFGRSQWQQAHDWFTLAAVKDDPKAIEGLIMASKRLGRTEQAVALADKWQDRTPEIGALYLGLRAPLLLTPKPSDPGETFLQNYAARTLSLESGEGAEALGWFAFNTKQYAASRAWFTKAMEWEDTETAAFGLAMVASQTADRTAFDTLKAHYGAKYKRVATLAFAPVQKRMAGAAVKRRSSASARAGSLRGKIAKLYQGKKYSACLRESRKLRSFGPLKAADHQMRGWCLLGADRPSEAERAFAAAVRMGGKKSGVSAYGESLAALRLGKTNAALSIANNAGLTTKQRRTIDIEILSQRARAAFNNQDYGATIYALDQRARLTGEGRDLALMRGWAHFHSGRKGIARQVFATLDGQLSTQETRRGLSAVRTAFNRQTNFNQE